MGAPHIAQPVEENALSRDGVSQAERQLAPLSPDYIAVDERSIRDLLVFAKEYAAGLNFFEDRGDAPVGDWQPFFAGVDLDEVLAFLAAPEKFSPEKAWPYARPHFALFLTFLQLLSHAQDQLNTLTKRHLDYYYQQVLGLRKRGPIPDQINVLVGLAPRHNQVGLAAGTPLDAGRDRQGQPLIYRTDVDISVNRAQVAKLHTVFADRSAVGLIDVWENRDIPDAEAVTLILKMTWGYPAPGDPLPDYPATTAEAPKPIMTDDKTTIANLETLHTLVDFVLTSLHLSFADYRELLACKSRYDRSNDELNGGWNVINQILRTASRNKMEKTGQEYEFNITNPADFETNFKSALKLTDDEFDDLFNGFPEVVTLKDAYSGRDDIQLQARINDKLYLPADGDRLSFAAMMEELIPIEGNWEEIVRILTLARKAKKDFNSVSLDLLDMALKDFDDFNDIIAKALGFDTGVPYPPPFAGEPIRDLTAYDAHLQALEAYFYMAPPDFYSIMDLALRAMKGNDGDSSANSASSSGNRRVTPAWTKAFALLDEAHKQKVYNERRAILRRKREDSDGGFVAMLTLAMANDDPDPGQDPLTLLEKYVLSQENRTLLESVARREAGADHDDPENFVSDAEWEQIYQIVERIQRVVLPEPRPQIESWRNLHPLDAANSAVVKLGVESEAESARWRTFGQAADDATPPAPTFGWAITSPILALSQGKRVLTLTLGFDPNAFQADELTPMFAASETTPFLIEVSTNKGRVPIVAQTIRVGNTNEAAELGSYWSLCGQTSPARDTKLEGIQFEFVLGEDFGPLAALPMAENHLDSPWPDLRLMMRATNIGTLANPDYVTPYLILKGLILHRVHVRVEVANLIPSHLQNDDGLLNPDRPFTPFGSRPAVGSRFYLGHPELLNKRLDSLNFMIDWMGVPSDLNGYYRNYIQVPADSEATVGDSIVDDNQGFKAQVSLVDHRKALPLASSPLFAAEDATKLAKIKSATIPSVARLLSFKHADDVAEWERYLQWELLTPDFQHGAYPGRATALAVKMAADIVNEKTRKTVTASAYQINPPYTPKIKKITLDYSSSLEIVVSDYQPGQERDRLYHIQPFGYSECQPDPEFKGQMFLPQFDYEGELYIGLRDLGTAQTVTLFFQMAEGSANPDLPVAPVAWHYLSGNRWLSLEQGQLLDDGTRGLINSGIIRFKLDPARANTVLDPELYWLRAAVRRHSNSICDAIDIHTQAVSATLEQGNDQPDALDHLDRPLPPKTITKLFTPQAEIAAIQQPYPSYGGKTAEQDNTFYTRISERLRHKDRALTQWDFERIILDHFPQIYKVKCLPATSNQPGQVTIVVIPDVRQNDLFDPFAPKVAANVIGAIEAYLAHRISAQASVVVKNPHYVPLKIRFAARFQPGVDEGFAKQRLNDDLNRFLSPWAYDEVGEIVIGGRIYANTIINFIEEQPDVDYVAEIRLFKSEDENSYELVQPSAAQMGYWVEANRPDGVLVAARQHEIDTISEVGYEAESFIGINYMKIELDFFVG